MNTTNSAVWFAVALVFITAIITKVARRTTLRHRTRPPPVVNWVSFIGLLHTLYTKGVQAMIYEQYKKLGSVFTINFIGMKLTFLVGPEVSSHFYQGLDSEISLHMVEFTVPMIGKEVGFGVDATTRNEQTRFYSDALKPSKLRSHVGPMLQEVEDHIRKWGEQGTIDLKQELERILILISSRCLLGKEVREKIFDEFFTLFHEMTDNGTQLASVLFPYAPTPSNRRRDRARAKLSEMLTHILRSRKSSDKVDDVLQNLIDAKYRDGRPTTEPEVIGLMIALIIAGKQSSSSTSTWTGVLLLNHPEWLGVAIKEQKEIIRKYGDHIDYDILLEMDNLHRCIKEALRMRPLAPGLFRKVHKDFTMQTKEGDMYEIPRGHTLVSPLHLNSKLPYIYKNPDVYDPERFGHEREEDKVGGKFSYLAFGCGRHACLGENYAYMQIKVNMELFITEL